jgi:peptidyl-prolyl cis-trans isomerase B (cyclophilin B)
VSIKREKELARAKFERQQNRRKSRQSRSRFLKLILLVSAIGAVGYYFTDQLGSDSALPTPITSTAPIFATAPQIAGCTEAMTPRANNISFPNAPTQNSAPTEINLETNCGDITIQTNSDAPNTVSNISFLIDNNFYNGIKCHRLTTDGIYVLQCGDPIGDGKGSPGFKFDDENLPVDSGNGTVIYPAGTVAMANSGPNTNGSQFFLVYEDSPLPPNYSIWGNITKGLDRISAIAAAGTIKGTTDGSPLQPVVISSATTRP